MDQKIESSAKTIFREGSFSRADIDKIVRDHSPDILDLYRMQIDELYEISFPSQKNDKKKKIAFINERSNPGTIEKGSWIFLPLANLFTHVVNEEDFYELITNRNKLLVNENEQKKLHDLVVIVMGMSVGSGIATSLVHSGIGSTFILADYDNFSTTNLNRVGFGLSTVGKNKAIITGKHLDEVNPFLNIRPITRPMTNHQLEELINEYRHKKIIIFDEIDDFKMKISTRVIAKKNKLPVVMLTALGDNLLIDIERHDTSNVEIFNGLISDLGDEISKSSISLADEKRFAAQLVGIENVPTRALRSLIEIEKSLVGRPQLYSTVSLDGGFAAFIIRQIILNNISGGRYKFSYDDTFSLDNNDTDLSSERVRIIQEVIQKKHTNE